MTSEGDRGAGGAGDEHCRDARGAARRPRRWLKRLGLGALAVIAVVLAAGFVLFEFGGMEAPTPEARAAYAQLVATGRATPVRGRFVVPIPGCVCHSSDPAQQVTHSVYRMSECGSCHGGGTGSQ